jgi:hypothetical protein
VPLCCCVDGNNILLNIAWTAARCLSKIEHPRMTKLTVCSNFFSSYSTDAVVYFREEVILPTPLEIGLDGTLAPTSWAEGGSVMFNLLF